MYPFRQKKMFLPKHLKSYQIPSHIKTCILEDGSLGDLIPDVVLVRMKNCYSYTLIFYKNTVYKNIKAQNDLNLRMV